MASQNALLCHFKDSGTNAFVPCLLPKCCGLIGVTLIKRGVALLQKCLGILCVFLILLLKILSRRRWYIGALWSWEVLCSIILR